MTRNPAFFLVIGLLTALSVYPLRAADSNDSAESRMRETLRSTLAQLSATQNAAAALQAAQGEIEEKDKALAKQIEAMAKQGVADRAASAKTISGLDARISEQSVQIDGLKDALAKSKAAHEQAAASARSEKAQREKGEAEAILLQRRIADTALRNAALFKLGSEILTRYEDFSLGNALRAKEPFVGVTRVKLENLAQEYRDKLADQKLQP